MDEKQPYLWTYDRSPFDLPDERGFRTFSVGVYQWLPKANGKGLKKSKTIRICGYVADSDSVYVKAIELCRTLNEEKARADAPPKWLQKQYSVPKPDGLIFERTSDDLIGSQVRSARIAVMKRLLLPVGFVKGNGGTYVRQQGDQIHLVDFQASMWGHSYTVNLGFHYAFIPGFSQAKLLPPNEFELLDCAWRARIGAFTPDGREIWFDYGTDLANLTDTLESNAIGCLNVFERWSKKWADPSCWLKNTNPNSINKRVAPWGGWLGYSTPFFVACVAAYFGQSTDVETIVETPKLKRILSPSDIDWHRNRVQDILRQVQKKPR